MKTGKTLTELAIELDRQNKTKRDLIVPTEKLSFAVSDEGPKLIVGDGSGVEAFGVKPVAHNQLSEYLHIPRRYYDRMLSEYPELLEENVNGWLGRRPGESRMIRTLDGDARAVLSQRYRRIDNYDVASAALPVIAEMNGAEVISTELTDSRMYIKVVTPRLQAEVKKGDIVQAGLILSNSEVGLGSVNVCPLIYRLVCTNGMVAQDSSRIQKRHVGRLVEADEDYGVYRDETIAADDKAFLMKLEDSVRAAVDEARFAQIVGQMQEATAAKMDARAVPKVVELAAKHYGLNENESQGVLGHLIAGGDLSLYGLANAVTRQAQDVASYDRSTELEATGYEIITMAPSLWKRLTASA